jgi:hypothetical protein
MGALMESRTWTWKASFVASRLLALYLLLRAIILAGQYSGFLSTTIGNVRWWVAISIIGTAVIGIWLWFASEGLAGRVSAVADQGETTPETPEASASLPESWKEPKAALWIGLAIVGVVIAVDGLTDLIASIGQLISYHQFGTGSLSPLYWQIASLVVRVAIGVWLVLRSRRLLAA